MARPRKPVDYENEFMRIDAQITKWTNTIQDLKEEKQALLRQREQEEISKLYQLYKNSDLSIDEVTAIVQKHAVSEHSPA